MNSEFVKADHLPEAFRRILPALGPGLLISIGYVDPGKWAATVDGGARFGVVLVVPMLIFNFAAILCQYLSARVSLVTGKDLAQICSEEYDKWTCMFLGVQTVLSVIALDLSMILGIAHGLHLLLGVDLSACVFLTAADAVFFLLFATLLERYKAKLLCAYMAGFILLFHFLGVLISQREIPLSMGGMLTRFGGESAFALMSLLGANIMPHNFYLHSSIVLQYQGPSSVSKDSLCYNHFSVIFWIFSGIFLVNYVLMNAASNVFYSTGLVPLTFPDAMSLLEQVLRSPIAPLVYLLILHLTSQISALSWCFGGQVVSHDFLKLDIPNWLQRATIRILAMVPALFCVWTSGVEGAYQLLIFAQVMTALLLPSSVIPLFRVASSRHIMGVYKTSQLLEFLVLITSMGMLGLKMLFVVEMFFGDSDWVGNLRWNMGSSSSVPYVLLLLNACSSFCLMVWLAATPLKSATQMDAQVCTWDAQNAKSEPSMLRRKNIDYGINYNQEEHILKHEHLPDPVKSKESCSLLTVSDANCGLPETIMESDQEVTSTAVEENQSDMKVPNPVICHEQESSMTVDLISDLPALGSELLDSKMVKIDPIDPVEQNVVDGEEKENDEIDSWGPEESLKGVPGSTSSLTSEGPLSFRSLSGKSDEGGNGTGSLTRLGGLGRAARRQFAQLLDDFWGQLYDFHGQATPNAKAKKLDVLLSDSKLASSCLKVDASFKDFGGYFSPVIGRGSDSLINPSISDSPKQLTMLNSIDSMYGVQRGSSSLWSNNMPCLDAYVQDSSRSILDSSERRYSSVRTLPSSDGWNNQPATYHGHQLASLVKHLAKDMTSNGMNGQLESPMPMSPSLGVQKYRDPVAVALQQNVQNGPSSPQASSYRNFPVSRNSLITPERPHYDIGSSASVDSTGMSANTKKYHSFSGPYRYMAENSTAYSSGYGSSVSRPSYENSVMKGSGSGEGGPLGFDLKGYRDYFPYMPPSSGSMWSKQPHEQFGLADGARAVGSAVGSRTNSIMRDTASLADSEAQLLQSFRCIIIKLLKLEGSDWMFRQNDGADEYLIDQVAAREKLLYEVETSMVHMSEPQFSSVPHCGEGCVWKADLIISFGVWCIHRVLDLSLVESRPELWGKYTYVLNRLQGVIELAFSRPRTPMSPCFCLQISPSSQRRSSPPVSNGMLPPTPKSVRGKCTTPAMLLELIKDVEIAISNRKGRSGTAAGDVAFPKGKENLASVLKRYKRRLSNKAVGTK